MKRRTLIIFAIFVLYAVVLCTAIPAIASDISDADFYGIIQTTNNGTAAVNVASNVSGLNSEDLIAAGFLNSSGNNCAIRNTAGTDLVFMPGYGSGTWIIFLSTLGTNSNTNSIGYFKDVTGGDIAWFPSSAGGSVTDVAPLEIGNNGSIQATVPITSSNYSILSKGSDLDIRNDGSGNITLFTGQGSSTTYPYLPSSCNNSGSGNAASFTANVSGTSNNAGDLIFLIVTATRAPFISSGAYGTATANNTYVAAYTFTIWKKTATASETNPTVAFTAASEYSYQVIRIPSGYWSSTPTISVANSGGGTSAANPPSLTSTFSTNATLYLAIGANAGANMTAPPANYTMFNTVAYSHAYLAVSSRQLSAASDDPGTFTMAADYWAAATIAIKGIVTTPDCSLSGLTIGSEAQVTFTQDGTHAWITTGGASSANYTAFSIPDNTSSWIWGAGAPYICDMRHYVSGVLQGEWDWEYTSGNFTDTTGHGYGLAPTYRTTSSDADVSSTLISFQPIMEPTAPAFAVGAGPDFLDTSNLTTGNYTTGNTSLDYPLQDLIESVATAGGVPYQIPSTFIASFGVIVISMLTSYFLKRSSAQSIFLKTIVNTACYGILVALHIYDWWMLIFFFIFEVSIWFGAQHRRE